MKDQLHELEKWKDLARQILSLAQEVIDNSEKMGIEYDKDRLFEEGKYKLIANTFLFSAREDFKAVYLLLTNSLASQAIMVVRHLFELMVNLRYISKCPDKRVKQYCGFDPIERNKWLSNLENNKLFRINQDTKNLWQEWLKESMKDLGINKLPKGFEWSGSKIDKMSEEVGMSNQYLGVYKICCLFTHPSPWGSSFFSKQASDGAIELNQPYHLLCFFWIAIGYFIDIIRKVDQILGTGLDISINEIFAKYEVCLKEQQDNIKRPCRED